MTIGDLEIEVVQKAIKNIHLAVYPPVGRVRIAAPNEVSEETLKLFVLGKLPWIRKQQRRFNEQNRQTPRQYVNRESHYFLGRKYLLRVFSLDEKHRKSCVVVKSKSYIDMYVDDDASIEYKAILMREFYRNELKKVLHDLVAKWEIILSVSANNVAVKSMKTKWGSCNIENKSLLFNLELAKKPVECIEYVVAHELIHLIERHHNGNFRAHLDKFLPNWKSIKNELNGHFVPNYIEVVKKNTT
jgi:predicted metal-dependent hydrolase